MWYPRRYETTYLYPTLNPGRTAPGAGRIAFVRGLRVAALPDLDVIGSWRTSPQHCPPTGLRRPDRTQRDPRLQYFWTGHPARRLFTSPSAAHGLHTRGSRTVERVAAPQSARVWPGSQHLDPGTGCQDQLRARDHFPRGLRRECAPSAQAAQNQLEACQALDHQPRSPIPAKKTVGAKDAGEGKGYDRMR